MTKPKQYHIEQPSGKRLGIITCSTGGTFVECSSQSYTNTLTQSDTAYATGQAGLGRVEQATQTPHQKRGSLHDHNGCSVIL